MKTIPIPPTTELLFVEVPENSSGIYLSRTGLIWYETEDHSCDKQKRDYSFSRDNCALLGQITKDGAVSQSLIDCGRTPRALTKDFIFGLMATNGIYLTNPLGTNPKAKHLMAGKVTVPQKNIPGHEFEKDTIKQGNKYLVLLKETIS
jgi:hypothetical protein